MEARKKQRIIAGMKQDITSIRAASAERQRHLERLTSDKGTIRSLALLYGMTGGEQVQPGVLPPKPNSSTPVPAAATQETEPFFLRHPVLLIIPGVILLLLVGSSITRRLRARQQNSGTNRSRCIKPSWTS